MIFNATDSRSYRKFGIFQKETFSSAYCFAKGRARVSILLSRQREGLTKQRVPSKKGDSIKRLPLARYFIYSNRADYLSAGSTRHALFLDTSISIQRSKQYPSVLSLSLSLPLCLRDNYDNRDRSISNQFFTPRFSRFNYDKQKAKTRNEM